MANTFLAARQHARGLAAEDEVELAAPDPAAPPARGRVLLPVDVVAPTASNDARAADRGRVETAATPCPTARWRSTSAAHAAAFAAAIAAARTLFWNGPIGVFEKPPFDAGSAAWRARSPPAAASR